MYSNVYAYGSMIETQYTAAILLRFVWPESRELAPRGLASDYHAPRLPSWPALSGS